jgi:hypothetical protein
MALGLRLQITGMTELECHHIYLYIINRDQRYFGTQAHAQLASALLSSTGSTHGTLTANPAFKNTPLFHIYNYGMTEKFNYGDCGPAKITATANSLFFYGEQFGNPRYPLYQRDRPDAADPLAILWYNPNIRGAWYYNLPLESNFPDPNGAWVSMRSSWTDPSGLFIGLKAGKTAGHATRKCGLPYLPSWRRGLNKADALST